MSQAGKAAANVKRAAEREHARPPRDEEKRKSDSESAEAHPTLTDTRLRSGHPQRDSDVTAEISVLVGGEDVKPYLKWSRA